MKRTTSQSSLRLLSTIAVLISILGVVYYSFRLYQINQNRRTDPVSDASFGWKFPVAKFPATGPGDNLVAYSDIRDPGGIPQGLPVRLKIPVIGVDSAIEDALITKDGRMDVPAGSINVAWFSLGPHPGRVGSAVIGGHFGISNGVPFVFYNLHKLKVGDKVYVEDDNNQTLAFIVRSIKSFDRNADATTVFTSGDGLAHLNLITCEGVWNQVNDSYPDRLVVFTDAIPTEGAITIKPKLPATAVQAPQATPTPTPSAPPTPAPNKREGTISSLVTRSVPYIKVLFGNTTDTVITSSLITAIIFVATKAIPH